MPVKQIWVDADACPTKAKQILFKAAMRTHINLILVANHYAHIPQSAYIRNVLVAAGFDEADKYIENHLASDDLVITADLPLAALVVAKGALALNPRGTLYTEANIKQQLAVRNLMTQLREQQLISGGAGSYNALDCKAFAKQLDRLLA